MSKKLLGWIVIGLSGVRNSQERILSKNVQITIFYFTITSKFFYFRLPLIFMNCCCKNYWPMRMIQKTAMMNLNLSFVKKRNTKNMKMNCWVILFLLPSVETIFSSTVAPGSWSWPIFLFSWRFYNKSISLHFLIIHFFYSCFCIIIVLEFLNK